MKRTLKYALSAALCFGIVAPVLAQEGRPVPPDVAETHWAYDALKNLFEKGLLKGYPDGLFRGPRPASRYELAVAVHSVYQYLMGLHGAQQAQIDELISKVKKLEGQGGDDMSGFATKAELRALQDQLNQLKNQVGDIAKWRGEIDTVKRMATTFERELSRLGVDTEQMKKDLSGLAGRVTKLEEMMKVAISGQIDFVLTSGESQSGFMPIGVDGRGPGRVGTIPSATGYIRSATAFHEAAITLKGVNEEGPKWTGTFVFGNMLSAPRVQNGVVVSGMGNQSGLTPGAGYREGASDVYIQDLNVSFDLSVLGNAASAKVGRMGYKISPLVFQRGDNTPYFSNERWDNGEYAITGGILGFKFGGVNLDLVFGRTADQMSANGVDLQPIVAGQVGHAVAGVTRPRGYTRYNEGGLPIDRMIAANVNFPLSDKGKVNLAYALLTSNTVLYGGTNNMMNSVHVFGADVDYKFGDLKFEGAYAKSVNAYNNSKKFDTQNQAYKAGLSYGKDKYNLYAKYMRIEPQFGAPGDWGRIGIWWNPTDVDGFVVGGGFKVSEDLSLNASGTFLKGLGKAVNTPSGGTTGMPTNAKVSSLKAGAKWHFAPNWSLMAGVERVEWNITGLGVKPLEQWYNVGVGLRLSDSAKFSLMYQYSDYDSKGVGYFNPFAGSAATRAKGGFISSQLSAKF